MENIMYMFLGIVGFAIVATIGVHVGKSRMVKALRLSREMTMWGFYKFYGQGWLIVCAGGLKC